MDNDQMATILSIVFWERNVYAEDNYIFDVSNSLFVCIRTHTGMENESRLSQFPTTIIKGVMI
jgi:hypothetical protein